MIFTCKCGNELNDFNWCKSRQKLGRKFCNECIKKSNDIRYSKNSKKYLESAIIKYNNLKIELFIHYGGKCKICFDNNLDHLSLDHIDGYGRSHRRNVLNGIDSGSGFYKWVFKNKPTNIRILCFNCNCQTSEIHKKPSRIKLKNLVFEKYGNKCCGCLCENKNYLTIDHINNNGANHRKEIGTDIYQFIKNNNFPKGNYQILCFNCNYIKSRRHER